MVGQSVFVVRVPEAEPWVQSLRQRCDPSASVGMPAHITVLFPFMPAERITSEILSRAETAVRTVRSFSFSLGEVGRWPETAYLLPNPHAPFAALTHALSKAFPGYRPYGGKYSEVVPHLTVADRSTVLADERKRSSAPFLPTVVRLRALAG